jgi:transcriptional regulator with XRE-family HTH domain
MVSSFPRKGVRVAVSIYADVGQRVRERRWVVGMTLQQLGDHVGITAQQLMKVETGTNEISTSLIQDIAAALGVPAMFFFEGLGLALGHEA